MAAEPARRGANDGRGLGELGRSLDALTTAVDKLVTRFDNLKEEFVSKDVADLRYEQTNARLAHLEGSKEWLVRTIGALIIAAVLGALYVLPKVAG